MLKASQTELLLLPALAALTGGLLVTSSLPSPGSAAHTVRAASSGGRGGAGGAKGNPYARGPAPTEASVTAARGPFAVATRSVPWNAVLGFGGGTIYYPKDGSRTYGAVAIVPGLQGGWGSISWLGPRIASQGFVVIGLNTHTTMDPPDIRGRELLSALDYLVKRSAVRRRIDGSRLAAAGYSLGGGGVLTAAVRRPSLKAAIGMVPYDGKRGWPSVRTPMLIAAGESDTVVPPSSSAVPLYNSLTRAREKAYLEFRGARHRFPQFANDTLAKYVIVWLKRFVDADTRYTRFLCPAPKVGKALSDVRSTCPM